MPPFQSGSCHKLHRPLGGQKNWRRGRVRGDDDGVGCRRLRRRWRAVLVAMVVAGGIRGGGGQYWRRRRAVPAVAGSTAPCRVVSCHMAGLGGVAGLRCRRRGVVRLLRSSGGVLITSRASLEPKRRDPDRDKPPQRHESPAGSVPAWSQPAATCSPERSTSGAGRHSHGEKIHS